MPGFRPDTVERLYLPTYEGTDDPAWVEVKTTVRLGDFINASGFDTQDELALYALQKLITAWNLQEDDGQIAPITRDNILRLELADFRSLSDWVSERLVEDAKLGGPEKKVSSASLRGAEIQPQMETSQPTTTTTE